MAGGTQNKSGLLRSAAWRITAFLLLAAVATLVMRQLVLRHQASNIPETISNEVVASLASLESRFRDVQNEMLSLAREVATSPELVQSLRGQEDDISGESNHAITSFFSRLDLPPWTSVELYDPRPRLKAWSGPTFPLDEAPSEPRFLDSFQTAIVTDGNRRIGLSIWWPVTDGTSVRGAIRVVRTVVFDSPVRNRFLKDYRLEDDWARAIGYPLQIDYRDTKFSTTNDRVTERTLFGVDGKPLAVGSVSAPSGEQILQATRETYNDIAAFWLALAGLWILFQAWEWTRNTIRSSTDPIATGEVAAGATFILIAIGVRYWLLELDIPGRFQQGKTPLAPLFDPSHLASRFGFGVMRSVGDLFVTSVFVFLIAAVCFMVASAFIRKHGYAFDRKHASDFSLRALALVLLAALVPISATVFLSKLLHRVILDSTLDYFARSGLLPENLVILVFSASLTITFSALIVSIALLAAGLQVASRQVSSRGVYITSTVSFVLVLLAFAVIRGTGNDGVMSFITYGIFMVAAFGGSYILWNSRRVSHNWLALRSILPTILAVTLVTYPFLFDGLNQRTRMSMVDAVEFFDEGEDPRVMFAVDKVLADTRSNEALVDAIRSNDTSNSLDSLVTSLARGSLFSSLGNYDLSLTVMSPGGTPMARFNVGDKSLSREAQDEADRQDFAIVRQMYDDAGQQDPLVETMTGRLERERFRFQGISAIVADGETLAWLMASAEPEAALSNERTPFPNVLIPASVYNSVSPDISIAEFRNDVLVRNVGESFGRFRLSERVHNAVISAGNYWIEEQLRDKTYLTYYHLKTSLAGETTAPSLGVASGPSIVAARMASANVFDHLYYLLRLTVSGLFIGLPVYAIGLFVRRQRKLIPAERTRFRDKVLNAFFAVGLVTVVMMGVVGLEVVTEENDRAIQSWLRQHLERVENTLLLDSRAGELPFRTLDRTSIDSLSARVGLDLNVYRGTELVASSRPQLVRDKLIATRLPMPVYEALHYDGYRFTTSNEKIGSFEYTAGYRAFPDESGQPAFIVSVPTLPEQERIEEERARTIAYLFGALLLLVLVVMVTASLLANALARPIGRLREGLAAVARGRYSQIPMLKTRDELSELVTTFNNMQEQLAESRRRLARQERQLAWREMARQVAHEIKNPLTPMKLSVQHLRRNMENTDDAEIERFRNDFERITRTLIEQIDSLARIANEFSTFARMPQRVIEELDLNAVVQEAASLMQAENNANIKLLLADTSLYVSADREELRRIYINLIKNAIQSIPDERTAVVTVTSRIEEGGQMIYSSISDNGSGIPDELTDKIFVPNFSTKTSGTGLGLAIVKESIEDLNGEIGFNSSVGNGTTFWIRLPWADSQPDTPAQ